MRAQFKSRIFVLLMVLGSVVGLASPGPARAADGGGSLVWLQGQKIVPSNGGSSDNFGTSVAVSAATVVVGAPQAMVKGNYSQGAAYVLTKEDGKWRQAQKLIASDGAAGDSFGKSVALVGNTIFVTAITAAVNGNNSQGAVYVFARKNGSWVQTQKLTAKDGAAFDEMGWSIAAAGDTMIVSSNNAAINGNARQGAAYVFTEANGRWTQTQKLAANDGAAGDDFSRAIAMEGTTALIGAIGATINGNSSQGAVYVFKQNQGVWSQTQKLVANDGTANSNFGQALAVSGSTALIGAPKGAVQGKQFLGLAYVFTQAFNGNWNQSGELTANDEVMYGQFGWSVALKNPQTALVGMPEATIDGRSSQGAAYAFINTNGDWGKPRKLITSDGQQFDDFGWAIASAEGVALIGAYHADGSEGAAYFYGNADLDLAMSVPARVNPGARFTSETIATNDSTSTSPAVTATIGVPAAASFISATASQGSCRQDSGLVTCDFGPIAGNAGAANATVKFKAAETPGTVIASRARLVRATPELTATGASLVNHPPVALDGSLRTPANQTALGALKAQDANGDPLVFSIVSPPQHGSVSIDDKSKGVYTYTPEVGYAGADSFTFKVNDGYMDSNAATVVIDIVNGMPVAKDDRLTTAKNTAAKGTLKASDSAGDALTFSMVAPPAHGSVKLDAASGDFTYTPNSDYVGADGFTFKASNGRSDSNTATLSITVEGSTPPPPPPAKNDGGGGSFGWPMLAMLLGLIMLGLYRLRRRIGHSPVKSGHKEMDMHRKSAIAAFALAVVSFALLFPTTYAQAKSATDGAKSGYQAGLTLPLPNRHIPTRVIKMAPQTTLGLLKQAKRIGPHAQDSTIQLTFALKLRNVTQLKQFLRDVQNPYSPRYHKFLTPAQFTAQYGPTQADAHATIAYLKRAGIEVDSVAPNRLLIQTEGTTETYEHALGIRINDYRLSGRRFFSTEDRPALPRALHDVVQSILGLNGGVRMRPLSHFKPLSLSKSEAASPAPPPASSAYYNPMQIATAYQWPNILDADKAAGETIAILTANSANLSANDYDSFWSAFGLPGHTVNITPVGNTAFPSSSGTMESTLDIEWSGAMSPGATLDVYVAADTQSATFTAMYNQFVTDDKAEVMTISWGAPEYCTKTQLCNPNTKADDNIFMEAAAQGISMFAAAGDAGASDCRPPPGVCPPGSDNADFPSSSPYITASNGTELRADVNGKYISETAWSDSGGATSRVFSRPDWQTGPGVPTGDWRYSSDMAMNAGPDWPYLLYFQGQWGGVFGTSAVAPQFAALFAIAVAEHGSGLGLSPKLIYDDVNAHNYASDFRDVTTGSNGYPAGPNWDHPTGWGSPKASNLIAHLGVHGPAGTLTGTVADAASGSPVTGATLIVMPGDYRRQTGSDGAYSMLLPVGNYTMTVKAFGYEKDTASVTIGKGATATQDFTLSAAPTAKLSGTVKDASGHGYGLYAEIKVSTSGFGQVADIWSNPTTGAYSLDLPAGTDYSLTVTPAFDGYQSASAQVKLADNVTRNFPLKITSTCTAPGYSFVSGLNEDFNGDFPPKGWSVVAGIKNSAINWEPAAAWNMGNFTGGTGGAADAGDSFLFGHPSGAYDTSLVSAPIPVTSLPANSILRYKANYQFGNHQDALDLDISSDGGDHWTTLLHWASAADNCGKMAALPGCSVRLNLAPYLPKSGSVELRWHYYDHALQGNALDWYAQVDDVAAGKCELVPGGLVFGQVTDANTGEGINWATVSDDKGDQTITLANPADSAFPVGGYLFFAPTGARTLTASDHRYHDASAQFTLANNAVRTQNFKLDAGRLAVTPASYSLRVMVNNQKSAAFTINNSGSAPAHFDFESVNAPPPATARKSTTPLQRIRGHYSALSALNATPAHAAGRHSAIQPMANAAPWASIADYPTTVMDNGMARDSTTGLVYSVDGVTGLSTGTFLSDVYVYDPTDGEWSAIENNAIAREAPQAAFLDGKLYVVGGWNSTGTPVTTLEVYDPSDESWSKGQRIPDARAGAASAVVNGQWYVVGGCTKAVCGSTDTDVYDPATGKWRKAADYPHPIAWESCGGIDGKLYCAGGQSNSGAYTDGYVYDPATDKWSPIPAMPENLWGAGYAAANGELLISGGVSGTDVLTNAGYAFDPNAGRWYPLPNAAESLYRGGSACGFYRVGGTDGSGAASAVGERLSGYDQCGTPMPVHWLTAAPQTGTVAAGGSADGQLIFDGTGEAEFTTSKVYLRLLGDTPYRDRIVPVTVTWEPQPVNLDLTGSVGSDSVRKGDSLSYTLTVHNRRANNHGPASQVRLTYPLPAGLQYQAASGDASCTAPSPGSARASASASAPGGTLICDFGSLARGASKSETLEVKTLAAGELTSRFAVTAREPESASKDNSVALTTQVLGTADAQLTVPESVSLAQGQSGQMQLTVANKGPDPASGLTLIVKPANGNVKLRSASSSRGTCKLSGDTISCVIGQLAAGGSANVKISAFGANVGSDTMNAQISTASHDPDAANDSARLKATVAAAKPAPTKNSGGGGALGWLALSALLLLGVSTTWSRNPRRKSD
jgi:hypothetical protein